MSFDPDLEFLSKVTVLIQIVGEGGGSLKRRDPEVFQLKHQIIRENKFECDGIFFIMYIIAICDLKCF